MIAQIFLKAHLWIHLAAQKEMEKRAKELGANAIVGVSYGYETVGQGGSMLLIAISGTAVVFE